MPLESSFMTFLVQAAVATIVNYNRNTLIIETTGLVLLPPSQTIVITERVNSILHSKLNFLVYFKDPKGPLPGKTNLRGKLSTVDLLVLTSLDQLILILPTSYTFFKTSYLNEEAYCTKPFNSVSVPCLFYKENSAVINPRS
jgi:hypothetical protein